MMKTFLFYILERFSVRSWRSDLEITRRIIGLLNKVQLCIFRHLSKEHCIAVYLFSRWFLARRKKCGWLSLALYLKASAVCLQRYYADSFDKHEALPFPVSLTRTGLPRSIPSFHRKCISMKGDRGDRIVKFYLSIFSLSKLILVGKKMNYQYKSIVSPPTSLPADLIVDIREKAVEFAERYIPFCFQIPMNLGFKWLPMWSASAVRLKGNPLNLNIKLDDPFNRSLWDLFTLSLWDRCIRNPPKANSKAHVGRIWPFLWENTKWASWNVQPTFSLFTPPYTLFPSKGELPDDYLYFPWSDDLYRGDLTEDHPRNRYYQAAAGLKSLIDHAYKHGLLKLGSAEWKDDYLLSHFTPGRLAFKMEGAGKVRTFAIPNSVKQALLRPAYERPEEHSHGWYI